jgi:hypothetical protein
MSIDPYKRFNTSLKFFIRELIEIFPQYTIFDTCHTAYKIVKTISKKLPRNNFNDIIAINYRQLILNEDESLFDKKLDFNESLSHISMIINELPCFKDVWIHISAENRKIIWQHLKVLLLLSDKCAL